MCLMGVSHCFDNQACFSCILHLIDFLLTHWFPCPAFGTEHKQLLTFTLIENLSHVYPQLR